MRRPTIEDFTADPENDLDGIYAWRQFGGLSVDEAYDKFCECPDLRQEDFMFMGDAAFVFYFPVLERFIHETTTVEFFDGEAHILAEVIRAHVSADQPLVKPMCGRIVDLCTFVLESAKHVTDEDCFAHSVEEIERVWKTLKETTLTLIEDS